MDVEKWLRAVRCSPKYKDQIRHVEILPERPGDFADLSRPLPDSLRGLLARRGMERLYSHQAEAIEQRCGLIFHW